MSYGRDHYNPVRGKSLGGASVIYVRKTGKDHFDGSPNRPLKTLAAAVERLPGSSNTGLIIDIGPGIWYEDLAIPPVRFHGPKKFSRSLSGRVGLGGSDTEQLGLVLRGSQGVGGTQAFITGKKNYTPKPVQEVDGNSISEHFFSPETKIAGAITSQPGSTFELACMYIDTTSQEYTYSVCTYGGLATLKGVVLQSSFSACSFESFSDIRLEGCVIEATREIQLRSGSILRTKDCLGLQVKPIDKALHIKL